MLKKKKNHRKSWFLIQGSLLRVVTSTLRQLRWGNSSPSQKFLTSYRIMPVKLTGELLQSMQILWKYWQAYRQYIIWWNDSCVRIFSFTLLPSSKTQHKKLATEWLLSAESAWAPSTRWTCTSNASPAWAGLYPLRGPAGSCLLADFSPFTRCAYQSYRYASVSSVVPRAPCEYAKEHVHPESL